MSITYPLSLPDTDADIMRITMRAHTAVALIQNPFTLQSQVFQFTGQMWVAEVTLPIMTREDADQWTAFLLKLNGPYGTFLLGDPSAATPKGTAPGSPKVKGSSNQGSTLETDGWTAGQTNVLKAGDMFQIGNNLYMNLNDVNSNGSGEATLDVFPYLREYYADNTTITTSSPKGQFRLLQTDYAVYSVSPDQNRDISFTCIEAIDADLGA